MKNTACAICTQNPPARGVLCGRCVNQLTDIADFFPEQVCAQVPGEIRAHLIDRWGRAHDLGIHTLVSRDMHTSGFTLCAAAVSREHAVIDETDEGWLIRDAGSRNGCFVNDVKVEGQAQVVTADRVSFSHYSFYFLVNDAATPLASGDDGATEASDYETQTAKTLLAAAASKDAAGEFPMGVQLYASDHALGGVAACGDATVTLTELQFALVEHLATRLHDDSETPVRGFVSIDQLLRDLPWNSPSAGEPQLKSLVYRIRAVLTRAGFPEVLERKRDLGYRLRLANGGLLARGNDQVVLPRVVPESNLSG